MAEGNSRGQLARLLEQRGFDIDGRLLRYDGRPWGVGELRRQAAGGAGMSAAEKKRATRAAKPAASSAAPRLATYAKNTWCPGCGNFAVLNAIKPVFQQLDRLGTRPEDIVLVSDIGCNSKIMDYLGVNSFDLAARPRPSRRPSA